jgi:hypothetical protein
MATVTAAAMHWRLASALDVKTPDVTMLQKAGCAANKIRSFYAIS